MCHIVLSLLLSHCWASTWVLLICMMAVQRLNAARLFLLGRQRKHCWLRGGGIRSGGKFNFPYEMPSRPYSRKNCGMWGETVKGRFHVHSAERGNVVDEIGVSYPRS